jgi:hypothetical protein
LSIFHLSSFRWSTAAQRPEENGARDKDSDADEMSGRESAVKMLGSVIAAKHFNE